jgi:hypothetical protein
LISYPKAYEGEFTIPTDVEVNDDSGVVVETASPTPEMTQPPSR